MSAEPATTGGRMEIGLLDVLEMPSGDVAAAVAFYRDVLGATVQSASEQRATVRLANIDVAIRLRRSEDGAPGTGWEPSFRVRDLAAVHAGLEAAGVTITRAPHDIPGGVRLGFADPDGNRLAAVQYGVTVAELRI